MLLFDDKHNLNNFYLKHHDSLSDFQLSLSIEYAAAHDLSMSKNVSVTFRKQFDSYNVKR